MGPPPPIPGKSGMGMGMGIGGSVPCRRVLDHVGNNICETYPRRIGQELDDASCIILGGKFSSFTGLPNPAWASLTDAISDMAVMALLVSRRRGS